ncbi:MAG: hypothetical protein M3Z98_09290 [Candidatus Dormibacteraeota bacterium]|nr:hypothetical protein [Candidatus Dormibacteraeota bacterium]
MRSLPIAVPSFAALSALLLIGACSLGSATANPTPSHSPTDITSTGGSGTVPQDLTFTGKLPARWTSAVVVCGPVEGKGDDSFSVKLTAGDGLGQMDTLTIVVASGYKGAGEYSVDTTTSFATAPPASNQIASSTPQLVTYFIVNADKASGTIDSTMGYGANALDAIERVAGTWRCR